MNAKTIFTILLFILTLSVSAQSGGFSKEKRDKMKAFKVSFITTELDLTTSEAQRFWPIYTLYDDKQFDLRHNRMRIYLSKLNEETISSFTEAEAAKLMSEMEQTEKELFIVREKYLMSLKKVLSAKKILLLKKVEDDFNRKLLQKYKEKS